MEILRVAPWLYPDTKGGADYHVHALSRDQAAMGHDVTVLTFHRDRSLPKVEEVEGYSVIRCGITASPLNNPISLELARYLQSVEDVDVIHAHSQNYVSTNLAASKRWRSDIPLAITNHGLYSQSAPKPIFGMYLRTLGRWTFNRADVIFCYADANKRKVKGLGVRSPIRVISNGVDCNRFTPDGPTSNAINADETIILFVGRLVAGKRPRILLETFQSYLDSDTTATLFVCGDGPLRDELLSYAEELGIADHVHFLGQIQYEEMPNVYRSADVLVLPSRDEGIPRVVLEATASGVPVVVTPLPGIDAVVSSPGSTVSFEDTTATVEAIRRAASSTKRPDWDRNEYSWEKTVLETTDALAAITREESQPRGRI